MVTPDVVTMFNILLETINTLSWNCQWLVLSIFDFPFQDRSTLFTAVQYLENRDFRYTDVDIGIVVTVKIYVSTQDKHWEVLESCSDRKI